MEYTSEGVGVLNDELAAFSAARNAWLMKDQRNEVIKPYGAEMFAAGIAYAQTWRSMESAPVGPPVLLLLADGSRTIGRWSEADRDIDLAAGWFDGMFRIKPTGWLPLPPTEGK